MPCNEPRITIENHVEREHSCEEESPRYDRDSSYEERVKITLDESEESRRGYIDG